MFYDLLYWFIILISVVVVFISYVVIRHVNRISNSSRNFDPINESNNSEKHGGELVAKVLKYHGVKCLFTLTGGHISPILVAAQHNGIQVVDTRHEVTAVFAADAYARLSGKIGVAAVTAGPGLTNTVTAVKNAQMAGSSVLVLSGAAPIALKGKGALQDIDQMSLMKSLCKYTVSVSQVKDIIPSIRKAVQKAVSGLPGPVFVELPLDVLYPYSIVAKEVLSKQNQHSFVGRAISWYSKYYLNRLFEDAFVPQDPSPLPIYKETAADFKIADCAKLLRSSNKPLMLIGSQGMFPVADCPKVIEAVQNLGVPCYLSGMARGMLGKDHNLLHRHKRREALREADLIILAGVCCDFRLSYGKDLNKKAKVIAVNIDKDLLNKNSLLFWNPTISIQCNVSDFLMRLASSTSQKNDIDEWMGHLNAREKEAENRISEKAMEDTGDKLNPLLVFTELEKHIDDRTVIVADGGDFVGTASYILRPSGPLRWLDPGPFGTLGVGAGFAIGAKLFDPRLNVLIIYGDGSLGYSILEFDTFIRHDLPVLAVVGNDACWGQIEREQVPMFASNVACKLRHAEYNKVVEALGGKGATLTGADKHLLDCKFSEAFTHLANHESVLVNVIIGKSDFRSGSISV